jgi:hypothetical protein
MQRIYEDVTTPHEYGVILRPESEKESLDCPNVFRHGDAWYMVYVAIKDEVGYETRLARSEDLPSWTPLATMLPFCGSGWDRWQADASVALADPAWGGSAGLEAEGLRHLRRLGRPRAPDEVGEAGPRSRRWSPGTKPRPTSPGS